MLQQRIFTAIALLAVLLPALFYPDTRYFSALALILVGAGAWEWANLNQCKPMLSLGVAAVCMAGCVVAWCLGWVDTPHRYLWIVFGAIWVLGGVALLYGGVVFWQRLPALLRVLLGVLALGIAWLAIVQARNTGINFLVSTLVLVWIADIFAYFAGRALGGRFFARKLAPSISPGKTWEGALGGLAGVLVASVVWHYADGASGTSDWSIFSRLSQSGLLFMLLAVSFLSAMSVVGDLVESLFKRSAGFKDSSGLLPGHGGVLDRLDALLPVLPLAMMLANL